MTTYEVGTAHEDYLEHGLGEGEAEGAAAVWRAAYPSGESYGEGEGETEAFFENLAEYAVGGGGRGALGGTGAAAARAAVASGPLLGVPLGQLDLSLTGTGYIDGEGEFEFEDEFEASAAGFGFGESEAAAMVMEHFGHAATEAETEAEAEAFIFPLLPLAAKFILPKVASFAAKRAAPFLMKRVMPRLARGAVQVARQLRANPQTRPLVRMMPTIARRTMADVARQVERGRPVTPDFATRCLARETRRVLDDPQECVRAYRRSRAIDRRYHHVCGRRES